MFALTRRETITLLGLVLTIVGAVGFVYVIVNMPRPDPVQQLEEMHERNLDEHRQLYDDNLDERARMYEDVLRQLDGILRDAEALQREVDEVGELQRENERLGDELERKIRLLEQQR